MWINLDFWIFFSIIIALSERIRYSSALAAYFVRRFQEHVRLHESQHEGVYLLHLQDKILKPYNSPPLMAIIERKFHVLTKGTV